MILISVQRVEKHYIKETNPYYTMLDEFCFRSKNLYNFANYHVRKRFIETGKWLRYNEMDKLLKQEGMDSDYRGMPLASSSQQCLRLLEKNWKSFFQSMKEWKKCKEKYNGRPKLPRYLPKNGRNILVLVGVNCKIIGGVIKFPKCFNGFTLKTNVDNVQQVRVLPRNRHIVVEIVYKQEIPQLKIDNGEYVAVDIGIDNLATLTTNTGVCPMIVSGRKIKSENVYYNKKISHYREIAKRLNKLDYTKRMNKLTIKRNHKIETLIHKASRRIIEYVSSCGANTIVIGNNSDWKRNSSMSKRVNQTFVGVPHQMLIHQVMYKAENLGINVIITEESYTSGTSFLDNELPTRENYKKCRRIYRGLFRSNTGKLINADVNGSYQIMKKVFPKAISHGIEGFGLNPVRVNL